MTLLESLKSQLAIKNAVLEDINAFPQSFWHIIVQSEIA